MAHDTGFLVLIVGVRRAAIHAGGIDAVMARGGDGLLHRLDGRAAKNHADIAPRLAFIKAVETVTRGDARLAARAFVEVHDERILLAALRFGERDQVAVKLRLHRNRGARVLLRKSLDGGERLLLGQQVVDQRECRRLTRHC